MPEPRPRAVFVRLIVFFVLIVAAWAALTWTPLASLIDRQRLAELLEQWQHSRWATPALLGLYLLFASAAVPVTPLLVAGGAVFGPWWGFLLSFSGSMLAASLNFAGAHYFGRGLVTHLVSAKRLDRVDEVLRKHGFWALVRMRFLPIPFGIANYAAALAGVPFATFLVTTALAMGPLVFVYTYFSHALVSVAAADRSGVVRDLALALVGVFLLTFIPTLVRWRRNWRR